ncbi:prepilin-type N-terminal cleavage/methylation domain-containing protein [Candidatus Dojkabacteria bacterium]|nr:prepilin-type N-terminal cleavage/methylation domain-containing protein [Candidatus Dojkabacteria bacterium]
MTQTITNYRYKKKKGFSLVELLVTMAIIAVLISIAAYGIQIIQRNARNTKRRKVVEDLALTVADIQTNYFLYPESLTVSFYKTNNNNLLNYIADYYSVNAKEKQDTIARVDIYTRPPEHINPIDPIIGTVPPKTKPSSSDVPQPVETKPPSGQTGTKLSFKLGDGANVGEYEIKAFNTATVRSQSGACDSMQEETNENVINVCYDPNNLKLGVNLESNTTGYVTDI